MEQYSVLNGGTAVTLEDGTVSVQYIDTGNGNFQYIVDQKDIPVQYQQHNQVIGIDHVGTVQLRGYQQPVIIDNSTPPSVILVEEVEPQQQTLQQQQFMVPQQPSQTQHTFFTTQNTPNGMMLVPATMTGSQVAVVTSVVQPSLQIPSEQQSQETELTNLITLNECNQVQVESFNSIQSQHAHVQPASNQNSVIYTQHLVADEGGGSRVTTNSQSNSPAIHQECIATRNQNQIIANNIVQHHRQTEQQKSATTVLRVSIPNGEGLIRYDRLQQFIIPELLRKNGIEGIQNLKLQFVTNGTQNDLTDSKLELVEVPISLLGSNNKDGQRNQSPKSNRQQLLKQKKAQASPTPLTYIASPLRADSKSELTVRKVTTKEEPKYVDGMLAVCRYCGYTSIDFNRCQRCKRKIPDDVKVRCATDVTQAKQPLPIDAEKFCSKKVLKLEFSNDVKKPVKRIINRKTRVKPVEEPVCLTISSDDEEHGPAENDSAEQNQRLLLQYTDPSLCSTSDDAVTSSILQKEPSVGEEDDTGSDSCEQRSQGVRGGGRELDLESIEDGSMKDPYTLLQCRTVRIGSYKVVPRDRILISTGGIRLAVPALEDEAETAILLVESAEIRRVLIHFGRGIPVIFFYTYKATAERLRSILKMTSKLGPYYDPNSPDETQRRITLLPERISEESKLALKTIFGPPLDVLVEINNKEANELLVRSSPKEVQNFVRKSVGTPQSVRTANEIQTIMVYPPPPAKGGIPINTEDYACLGEDQFLNDVIIDFYLKFLTLSILSDEDQARTHVFSSFFYKRLTTRPVKTPRRLHPIEDDPKLSAAEKRHSRVKSWTKNVNIFEKDFIIIPINENCHWFLAIICFPKLVGCVRMSDNTPILIPTAKRSKTGANKKTYEDGSIQIGSTVISPIKPTTITIDPMAEEGSDRDEAEGEDDDMVQSNSEDEEAWEKSTHRGEGGGLLLKKNAKIAKICVKSGVMEVTEFHPRHSTCQEQPAPVRHALFADIGTQSFLNTKADKVSKTSREPIKQPCILIFDSLAAGTSRSRVVATLRDYLRIEHKIKEGKEREFSKDIIKGASPKVPQQSNFTDCGVYLLQYVESFFKDPIKDYHLPMKSLINWFPEEIVNRKRQDIQSLLLSLMAENKVDIESLNLPQLSFSKQSIDNEEEMEEMTTEPISNQNADGRLIFTSTEEEMEMDECREETVNEVITNPDSSISVQCQRSESLVCYSDSESEAVDLSDAEDGPGLRRVNVTNNTMTYLKSKRIDDNSPVKKMKTDVINHVNIR